VLRPVNLDTALIGQSLPWDVYSESGVLIAGAGLVLTDESHFQRLTNRPLFRMGESGKAADAPLTRLVELAQQVSASLRAPDAGEIRALVRESLALRRADADACLGYASLMPLARPAVGHALRVLLVAVMVAESLNLSDAEQESVAAAALTMNLASLDLHDRLHDYAGILPEAERSALLAHPQAGATCLEQAGVDDTLWLDAVRQHHENLDGSGYPRRLSGDAICLAARLLRVADFYCAKIGGRNYRPPKSADFAYQELFGREKGRLDTKIATLLLRRIGLYPPGTLVRLANHETACIARHTHDGSPRWVVSVLDARQRALDPPRMRDLGNRNHAIIGSAERLPGWPAIDWMAVWGY
jgi:hypothetical protein